MNTLRLALALSTASAAPAAQKALSTNFTPIDWVIVALYLIASIWVGVYANKFIHKLSDYLVAGRGLGIYLAVATMTGTELGLVTVMYNAEEGFRSGFSAFVTGLIACVTSLIIGMTGVVIMRLRGEGVMTIPEYYERRFGPFVRWLGGVVLSIACVLNFALFLQVGAKYVTIVTGLEAAGNPLKLVMTGMLVLVLIYTALGGMVSVVITDFIQFVVLSVAMVIATLFAFKHIGGWAGAVSAVQSNMGEAGFNPIKAGRYGWTFILWMAFLNFSAQLCWLPSTLRALSAESEQVAKRLYMWSGISFLIRCIVPMFWGIAAFALIKATPELNALFFPADGSAGLEPIKAMPVLFSKILPVGLIGLVTAGMLAAFMSTHDSYFLAFASVLTQDVIAPPLRLVGKELTDIARIWITRFIIVLMGAFVLWFGLWYTPPESTWKYMAATGSIYLPGAFMCIFAGIYWKRASSFGAFLAVACGLFGLMGLADWPGIAEQLRQGVEVKHVSAVVAFCAQHLGQLGVTDARGKLIDAIAFLKQDNIAVLTIALSAVGMIVGSAIWPSPKVREEGRNLVYELSVVVILSAVGYVGYVGWKLGLTPEFWETVFDVGCGLFVVMALMIAVGGVFDIKRMFRLLERLAPKAAPAGAEAPAASRRLDEEDAQAEDDAFGLEDESADEAEDEDAGQADDDSES